MNNMLLKAKFIAVQTEADETGFYDIRCKQAMLVYKDFIEAIGIQVQKLMLQPSCREKGELCGAAGTTK